MFNRDPKFKATLSELTKLQLEKLGMEAKSILKSIQTEHTKLEQAGSLARSDLHYFRARFNYYRLSLMRLLPDERKILESFLSEFRASIVKREAFVSQEDTQKAPPPTPFLSPVETQVESEQPIEEPAEEILEEVEADSSIDAAPTAQAYESAQIPSDLRSKLLSELSLIQLALQAEPSKRGNQTIADAVSRMMSQLR